MIDRDSLPGSYADALRYPHSIRVSEYPGDTDPVPGNCGAVVDPDAAPPLSDKGPVT